MSAAERLHIDYLANHKQFIAEIADLSYVQWGDLFRAAGIDLAMLKKMLEERATIDTLPITLVALRDGTLIGTGSIKLAEPGTKPGLSPWLAGMLVKRDHRGHGVGARIVQALEDKARALGIEALYLSVGAAEAFYARLGWSVLERVDSYGVKQVALMTKRLDVAMPDARKVR